LGTSAVESSARRDHHAPDPAGEDLHRVTRSAVIVYAVVDNALPPDFPLSVELEAFIRREDAERFIEEGARR
jgi:hypothetical protein